MEHPPVCHLLRVPPEIRLLIYQRLFYRATLYIPGGNKPPFKRCSILDQTSRQDRSAQILRTCHNIYVEAAKVLYSQIRIDYDLIIRSSIKYDPSKRGWDKNLGTCLQERYLHLIPCLTIRSKVVFDGHSFGGYSINDGMRLFGRFHALKVLTLDLASFEPRQDLDQCKKELRGSSREHPGGEKAGGVAIMRNFEKALEEGQVIDAPLTAPRLREVLQDAGRRFEVVVRVGVRMQRWRNKIWNVEYVKLSWPPRAVEVPNEGGADKVQIRRASDDGEFNEVSGR